MKAKNSKNQYPLEPDDHIIPVHPMKMKREPTGKFHDGKKGDYKGEAGKKWDDHFTK